MENLIQVKHVIKQYGTLTALDRISLTIHRGQVAGIVGPNGSGKTTLLKIMLGLIDATSGSVMVGGKEINANSLEARKKIGIVVEDQGAYGHMKVRNYLLFFSKLYGFAQLSPQVMKVVEALDLTKYMNVEIAKLSKGNKQKVNIARALVHEPDILFLDEATDNLDPEVRESVLNQIRQFRKEGKTVIMCSHNLHEVEQVADQVFILKFGKLIDSIRIEETNAAECYVIQVQAESQAVQRLKERLGRKVACEAAGEPKSYLIRYEAENPDELRVVLSAMSDEGIQVIDFSKQSRTSLNERYMSAVKEVVHQ
ncbi:ATP-binding cassette domain-containing protein [Paenibacillus sp. HJL G12]|uniref:ATP-binding cassette domain-containing protein n=1 Tax=Paenibacillus dendrobii TaxID=2691084 RepID=A0A7X3IQ22_9BACL|nr:ABC transporter ATP-binding protein [Paenibacillus dendrobii]MWV47356.1 ATP-binding cassette domain-containing protein [Paenibacillus dendrobii]